MNAATMPFSNWKTHLLVWLLWAMAFAVYLFKIARFDSSDWGSYVFLLAVHIGTCYCTARFVFRYHDPQELKPVRLIIGLLLEMVLVFVFMVVVSIADDALSVGLEPGTPTTANVLNGWEVMFMLYAGIGFGSVYANHRRKDAQRRAAECAAADLKIQLNDSEVMKLSSMLIPHLINNLLSTLTYVAKHHPQHTRTVLWMITQIVHFYAALRPNERISVRAELEIAEIFLELQEYGLGYAPEVDISVDEDLLEKSIIPMLILLPLENICKYAVLRHATQEAWIRIKQEDGLLVIHAENEVHGTRKSNTVSTQNGLLNMKEKLRYMDVVYHLEHDTVDGRYVFRLALQVD